MHNRRTNGDAAAKWSVPALAIRRPITTLMVLLTVLSLGAVAYTRIPLEFLSMSDVPMLSCWIPYPGSLPEQVENEVTIPAEGIFRTVPRLKQLNTWSETDGCYVFMRFDWGTDMSLVTAEVRDRIERLKLQLPEEIDRLHLRRWGQDEWAVIRFGLFRGDDREEIAWLADKHLRRKLERLEGVAEVEIHGEGRAVVYIEFEQDALRGLNLSLYSVVEALRTSSLNLSVGSLEEGKSKYYVRALGEFTHPRELENIIIAPNGARVKDVATVSMRQPPRDWNFALDGQRGVFIDVKKESQANTVETCDAVREVLEDLKKDPLFHDVRVHIVDDQSEKIRATLGALVNTGRYGGLLALSVLFIFLRRLRATLLVGLAIPASLLVSVVYMYFAGITFNVVTLSAMIVSIGMLVDNSIVVIENIHRRRLTIAGPVACAQSAASEVGLAITTATLTTMVVFIPVVYIEMGEMSLYMRQFASPICVALLASLVLALSVIPLASTRIYRQDPNTPSRVARWLPWHRHPDGRWARLGSIHVFQGLTRAHARILRLTLRHRLAAILLFAALAVATYLVPFSKVGMQQMPTLDTRQVTIHVSFERYDQELAEKTFRKLEAKVNELREALGIEGVYVSYGPWGGRISAGLVKYDTLPPGAERPPSTEEVRDKFLEDFPKRLPGAELHFEIPQAGVQETQSIRLSIRGDDSDTAAECAERFKTMLRSLPYVVDARTDRERAETEIQLRVDESLAARAGISSMVLARTVGFALRGTRLSYIKREGREVEVWAQFQGADRSTREDLDNVAVLTPSGELIPLSQLVASRKGLTPRLIRREDGKSVTQVTAEVNTKDMTKLRQDLAELKKLFALPRGYTINEGMMLVELGETESNFTGALTLAIILMYLLMAALFESYLLPLSILTTVPLAFIGVYWSMYLTGTAMDTISFIGAILMCGIIVNNGIVIVDHINQLRRRHGLERNAAILQGGRDRLRPVLMTALTTILGCIPLAIGTGENDLLYSMGRALVGGLTMGTVLTLFIVPLFYSAIDDLQHWFRDYFGALAGFLQSAGPARASVEMD